LATIESIISPESGYPWRFPFDKRFEKLVPSYVKVRVMVLLLLIKTNKTPERNTAMVYDRKRLQYLGKNR